MPVGQAMIQLLLLLLLWLLLLHCVAPANTCAAEGAAEQQQMVESIHAMIGDLEVEKQSFLATMNSQQVRCLCCMLPFNCRNAAFVWRKLLGPRLAFCSHVNSVGNDTLHSLS